MITTLSQLLERNKKLKILDERGLLSSDEAIRLQSETIDLNWKFLEEETHGVWEWWSLKFDSDKKEGFWHQIKILIEDGHLCLLPSLLNDKEYNTVRVMTDLSSPIMIDIFSKFRSNFIKVIMVKDYFKKVLS